MAKRNIALRVSLVFAACVIVTALTIWGAIWVSNIDNRKAAAAFPMCEGRHASHKVDIRDDKTMPSHVDARRCDTLTITNLDDQPRIIAFGKHDKHVAYDGVRERYLSPDGTFTVTLIQPGSFLFHDHNDEKVQATFTVDGTR